MFKRKTPVSTNLPNSLYSLESLILGGIQQSILIRTDDKNQPIVLFLHGGPGTAQIGFARRFQRQLEKDFIVVNWDQRGSGISESGELTLKNYLNDAKELIQYLLKRFGKEKLYLVGHSWGSILGSLLAQEYHNYLYAYIGVGQIICMTEGERISFDFVKEQAEKKRDKKALELLHTLTFEPDSLNYLFSQRKLLDKYKGSLYSMTSTQLFFGEFWHNTEYLVSDWFRFMKRNKASLTMMWKEVAKIDFRDIIDYSIPIYFCAGRYDFNTPSQLVEEYFHRIHAPVKEFVWFENSGHCPPFEEHEKFNEVLCQIKKAVG
ncbi:alpha/beta fold hydrolase [Neobacillus cucumis]|uniref:alpha/beta fold hydrolase n=1 Tax=Neobacillus cucumis TaxID=1740721 RepID=UPI0028530AA4|nr:alpha/beta hydrolase [Neobacillus cucumis]MDR4947197.1 alpha/beta hydrolase [Neobacillus cucumis]